jgi:RNA polymerase sigma-70 factor (ECF subfamily)
MRGPEGKERDAALAQLIELYWKPTYCWLRRYGYNDADAKDLAQEFFLSGLQEGRFEKADAARGRFRTFFLTCLKNFIANFERDRKAKGRQPSKPFLTIDKLRTDDIAVELIDKGSPEDSFNLAWVRQLLLRVLRLFEQECLAKGKECHCELFRRRIIEPLFEGTERPQMRMLAEEMGLSEKEAFNYDVNARRAYRRLLREEIRTYAATEEEVTEEIKELFRLLSLE